MRVLVFTHHYPSARYPTRASYSVSTYGALARHCELRVVAPVPWWERLSSPLEIVFAPRDASTGIEASFPTFFSVPGVPALHAAGLAASMWRTIRREHAERPFSVLLAAWAYPDTVAAALLAKRLGVPMVTTVLGSDINEAPALPGLRPQITWALKRARRVVAVSRALGDAVVALGVPRERVVVQHNGVNGERFVIADAAAARRELDLPLDRKIVLYVGNLMRAKGVDFLVEAAAELRRSRPEALVVVVGGGPEDFALRARAAELGLGDTVRFAGRRLHAEVHRWMAACDVFVLPSRREGCPNVILEALASGRPVVAARVGGVPELVRSDTGILVEPESPSALARGIAEALGRTWSPEILRASVPALSWDEVARTYRELLEDVVIESSRSAGAA